MKPLYFDLNVQHRELREEILAASGRQRGAFRHTERACDRVLSMPLL